MFTIDQIATAHSKVKSGADFPNYIQELIKIGVSAYDTYVKDGHTAYTGTGNQPVYTGPKYEPLEIAAESDARKFTSFLKSHQQGHTDYPTFCRHSAETGVEKWRVDIAELTCTYYDKAGNKMLEEKIPRP